MISRAHRRAGTRLSRACARPSSGRCREALTESHARGMHCHEPLPASRHPSFLSCAIGLRPRPAPLTRALSEDRCCCARHKHTTTTRMLFVVVGMHTPAPPIACYAHWCRSKIATRSLVRGFIRFSSLSLALSRRVRPRSIQYACAPHERQRRARRECRECAAAAVSSACMAGLALPGPRPRPARAPARRARPPAPPPSPVSLLTPCVQELVGVAVAAAAAGPPCACLPAQPLTPWA